MLSNFYKELFAPILSLFTSLSTLVCCALPALLVTVGLGTTLVSIVSIFPWIVVLSKYKLYIFILAGFMLALSCYMAWRRNNSSCPANPAEAKICLKLRSTNSVLLTFSFVVYITGFFFAFLADLIFF